MGENKDYITFADEKGSVNISEEVISILAATAAIETEGVAGLSASSGKELHERLGRKNISKGVHLKTDEQSVVVDIYIMIKFGNSITELSQKVQDNVKNAIESASGLEVLAVNVHVCGVSFDREK
jgi:uncharacterized alkaline shock family protein YloU